MTDSVLWLDQPFGRQRFGLKGPRAAEVLQQSGFEVPDRPNSWAPLRAGEREDSPNVIGRLGNTEFFIEEEQGTGGIARLEARLAGETGVYPVLREDFAVVLSGARAPQVLAEVCNVDFAALPLAERPVVMTLLAGVAVLVLPQPQGYRIWCDPSFGPYLQETLAEVTGTSVVRTTMNGRAE